MAVTLQNGLGNLETIAQVLGPDRALLGMTYVGAAQLGPGHARLSAPGQTFLGEPGGQLSPRVLDLARRFGDLNLETKALSHDSRVIIMDEPTAALNDAEVATLHELIRGFVSPSHFSKCYSAYFGYRPSKEKRLVK